MNNSMPFWDPNNSQVKIFDYDVHILFFYFNFNSKSQLYNNKYWAVEENIYIMVLSAFILNCKYACLLFNLHNWTLTRSNDF